MMLIDVFWWFIAGGAVGFLLVDFFMTAAIPFVPDVEEGNPFLYGLQQQYGHATMLVILAITKVVMTWWAWDMHAHAAVPTHHVIWVMTGLFGYALIIWNVREFVTALRTGGEVRHI